MVANLLESRQHHPWLPKSVFVNKAQYIYNITESLLSATSPHTSSLPRHDAQRSNALWIQADFHGLLPSFLHHSPSVAKHLTFTTSIMTVTKNPSNSSIAPTAQQLHSESHPSTSLNSVPLTPGAKSAATPEVIEWLAAGKSKCSCGARHPPPCRLSVEEQNTKRRRIGERDRRRTERGNQMVRRLEEAMLSARANTPRHRLPRSTGRI